MLGLADGLGDESLINEFEPAGDPLPDRAVVSAALAGGPSAAVAVVGPSATAATSERAAATSVPEVSAVGAVRGPTGMPG